MSDSTHFDRLGLPPTFALDPADVERNYLARSRELHPDYHQSASSAEQRASLELSASLNEAYAILRQPFRRAEYLLALHGGPTAAEHKTLPAGFLEEMLDLRMEIEGLRESSDSAGRSALEKQLTDRRAALVSELERSFAAGSPSLPRIRETLNAAKYIDGLLRDLRAD